MSFVQGTHSSQVSGRLHMKSIANATDETVSAARSAAAEVDKAAPRVRTRVRADTGEVCGAIHNE